MVAFTETFNTYTARYEAESVAQLIELMGALDARKGQKQTEQAARVPSNKHRTPANFDGPKPPPGCEPPKLCEFTLDAEPIVPQEVPQ